MITDQTRNNNHATVAMQTAPSITEASKALFITFCKDSGNWAGNPMIDITPEQCGNLTQLKKSGLLGTFRSDGCDFVSFTSDGIAYAATLGFDGVDCR